MRFLQKCDWSEDAEWNSTVSTLLLSLVRWNVEKVSVAWLIIILVNLTWQIDESWKFFTDDVGRTERLADRASTLLNFKLITNFINRINHVRSPGTYIQGTLHSQTRECFVSLMMWCSQNDIQVQLLWKSEICSVQTKIKKRERMHTWPAADGSTRTWKPSSFTLSSGVSQTWPGSSTTLCHVDSSLALSS